MNKDEEIVKCNWCGSVVGYNRIDEKGQFFAPIKQGVTSHQGFGVYCNQECKAQALSRGSK